MNKEAKEAKEALICCSPLVARSFYEVAAQAMGLGIKIEETIDGNAIFVTIADEDRFREFWEKVYGLAGGSGKFHALFLVSKLGGVRVPKT